MSRSFTKSSLKGYTSGKQAKKNSSKIFRQKSKKDPEGVTQFKKQGLNKRKFPSNHGQYTIDNWYYNYKSFSK